MTGRVEAGVDNVVVNGVGGVIDDVMGASEGCVNDDGASVTDGCIVSNWTAED